MNNKSIWKDIKIKKYPKLNRDIETDILIIGGGITGISTLYHLKDSNLRVILVEQNKIGFSTTGNSTGKLSYLQNNLIDKIRTNFNDDTASLYLNSQIESINNLVDIINKENIDCDLEKVNSYLYTNNNDEIEKIKDLEKFLIYNNIKVKQANINIVKSKYMIKVDNTYTLHPIKLIYGLLKYNKYPIYENTSIKKIEKYNTHYSCYTEKNKIVAKKVIIASHYPYFIFPYFFPIKCSLEKSYLSASRCKCKNISLISYSNPFISIRNYKDYLIYLSNSHDITKDTCDKKHFNELIKKVNNLKLNPEYIWSNIDIMTNDGLPYIGEIKKNLLIGTGYNTWGISNGFLAGKILSDIINKKENAYLELFSPKRINLTKFMEGITDIGKNIRGYTNGFINKNYTKASLCPHAKCKLIYNEIEQTWDCPCHGSRFDKTGKCINGPANKNIIIKDKK